VKEDEEREFLRDIPIQKCPGSATRRARPCGPWHLDTRDIAHCHWAIGETLWIHRPRIMAALSGKFSPKRLVLEHKPRTCIGRRHTLPYDEPDYETALLFLLDQTEKVVPRSFARTSRPVRWASTYASKTTKETRQHKVSIRAIRTAPHQSAGGTPFHELTAHEEQPIRQVCINYWNPATVGIGAQFLHHDVDSSVANCTTR